MSDTENKPNSQPEPKNEAPAGISRDEFMAFQTSVSETLGSIKTSFEALANSRNANPNSIPTNTEPDINAADIDKLITEGKPVGDLVERLVENRLNKKINSSVNPSLHSGMGSLANITLEVVKPQLKFYDRFKKEIDDTIAQMPAEARINPEAYKIAHNAVVGKHAAELVKEAQEQAVRASRDASTTGTPSGESKSSGSDNLPSWDEVFGAGASDALKHAGKHGSTPDEFAKRMGYKDAQEYIKFTLEQRNGVIANA